MNRSFTEYKIDKSKCIEFAFTPDELKYHNIKFQNSITSIEEIYLSVHSSQSISKTGIFNPINIKFDTNEFIIKYFEFSKYFVKSLQ